MTGTAFHPLFGGVIRFETETLPDDPDSSVAATVRKMTEYAVEDSRSPGVERAVLAALPVGQVRPVEILENFHQWIRRRVRFEEDDDTAAGAGFGSGNEVLIRPVDLLSMSKPSEDCDGFSMLVASMVLAAGRLLHLPFRVSFVTVAANPERPREFSHVYCYVGLGGRLIAFDASHGPYLGWEINDRFHKRAVWPVGEFMFARTRGRIGRLGQDSTVTLDPSVMTDTGIIQEPIYPIASAPAPSTSFSSVLPTLVTGGLDILRNVTLPSGAYEQVGPGGTTIARQVPGAVPMPGVSLATGGGFGSLLLIGGVGLLAVALLSRGR